MTPMIVSNGSTPPAGTSGTGSPSTTGSTSPSGTGQVTETMFLQLLVAQLEHQDPMQPQDGTQFIGELAQFQQLEQSVNTGQDVSSILQDLNQLVGPAASSGSH